MCLCSCEESVRKETEEKALNKRNTNLRQASNNAFVLNERWRPNLLYQRGETERIIGLGVIWEKFCWVFLFLFFFFFPMKFGSLVAYTVICHIYSIRFPAAFKINVFYVKFSRYMFNMHSQFFSFYKFVLNSNYPILSYPTLIFNRCLISPYFVSLEIIINLKG